jgi:diketogulonate reductase-like aldo/keto reductase
LFLGKSDKAFGLPADHEVVCQVVRLAEERAIKPAHVALAWLLAKPVVAAPILGASKLDHLQDAVAAVDIKWTAAEVAALERPYQPKPHLGITRPFQYPPPGTVHDRGWSQFYRKGCSLSRSQLEDRHRGGG